MGDAMTDISATPAPAMPDIPAPPQSATITVRPSFAPEDMQAAGLADDGSASSVELDYGWPSPPPSPGAYQFESPPDGVEAMPLNEQIAIRAAFHAEGIDQGTAGHIVREWNKACKAPPTPEQIELSGRATAASLRRLWGEQYEANMAAANAEFDRFAQRYPTARKMLELSGMGNSEWLIRTLHNRAQSRGAK